MNHIPTQESRPPGTTNCSFRNNAEHRKRFFSWIFQSWSLSNTSNAPAITARAPNQRTIGTYFFILPAKIRKNNENVRHVSVKNAESDARNIIRRCYYLTTTFLPFLTTTPLYSLETRWPARLKVAAGAMLFLTMLLMPEGSVPYL